MKEKNKFDHISIVCSGEDYSEKKIKECCKKSDYIIAVDGGLKILSILSITPDLILGDMDSIEKNILLKYQKIKKEEYPTDKDFTDSELAIRRAMKFKPLKISLLAATGSYFDHSFANIINLLRNFNKKIDINLITKNSIIFPIVNKRIIKNSIGRRFSVFPIGNCEGIILQGCKYTFKDKSDLLPIDYSISNIITENKACISIKKGMLICILFDESFL
jgi:thiamine pyrophosphokinase